MSKIEELIKEKCPNGIKYRKLKEIGDTFTGLSGKSKDDFSNGNCRYITYTNIFNNPAARLDLDDKVLIKDSENQNILKYGDILVAGSSENIEDSGMISVICEEPNENIYLNSFCFGFRLKDSYNTKLIPAFSKHIFRSANFRKQILSCSFGVTRYNLNKKMFLELTIPIPPIEVQKEIVKILDKFGELETELETELEVRKSQYEFWRERMCGGDIEELKKKDYIKLVKLSELGEIIRGKRFVKADAVEIGTPCMHYGELYTHYGISAFETKSKVRNDLAQKLRYASKNDVIIVGAGENNIDIGIGVAWLGNNDVAIHDACYILKHNINPKYIAYYLRTKLYHNQLKKWVSEGKICAVSAKGVGESIIPVPSLEEQERIVNILDKFDKLVNDISEGLPAEIEARKKQYEYYRNKLLTFEEVSCE